MKTHIDKRGVIMDLENGVVVITCNEGSKRANHYHKVSSHRSILNKGSLDYYEKPTGTNLKPTKQTIVAPAVFDTSEMVDHLMHFKEYSEFVCIRINGSQNPEEYEKDVVRLDYDLQELYDNWPS